jgi:protein-S-isoprenylcysteine O-methyltransferase Ste14
VELARAVEVIVTCGWPLGLLVKVSAQRRLGIPSVVVGRTGEGAGSRVDPLLISALFAWFALLGLHGLGLVPRFLGPRLVASSVLESIGAALELAGLASLLVALVHMGRAWRIGIDRRVHEELVTHGVFALSRNPIYVGMDLTAVGAALGIARPFFLASAAVILVGVHAQILREERFLAAVHGEEYERYRAKVRRYLGRRREPDTPVL